MHTRLDFLIIGAQKCGTTALAHFLQQHPQIFLPESKELHFFDFDKYWKKINGSDNYARYHRHFNLASQEQRWGEATPNYLFWQPALSRIHAYNSKIKLICLLRNPIERAYSQWVMECQREKEKLSFSDLIRQEIQTIKITHIQDRVRSYVSRGLYAQQLKRLFHLFSYQQTFIIKSDDLRQQHQSTMSSIFDFLEVSNQIDIPAEIIFSNSYPQMRDEDIRFLQNIYADDIRELEHMLNWDCSTWLQNP